MRYNGPFDVSVEDVPDARIEQTTDAVVRITTTNICGSDLHMYEGRTSMEVGRVLGHENMGVVEEVGPGVQHVQVGDRVSVPFNIGCGELPPLPERLVVVLHQDEPDRGHGRRRVRLREHGPVRRWTGRAAARALRRLQPARAPAGDEHEHDFTMLSDIFPTGWHGVTLSGFVPGDRVVVYGGGPVGLMAAHSAMIRGATEVFVVDQQADRLRLADSIGAHPIDFSQGDPVEQAMEATKGAGADRGVEAVGYQAHDHSGQEHPEPGARQPGLVGAQHRGHRRRGRLRPGGPGGRGRRRQGGSDQRQYGQFFTKGQTMGTGQAPVKRYNRRLRDLIVTGRATPSFIVSHEPAAHRGRRRLRPLRQARGRLDEGAAAP
ncbi:aldehyde dehydrogenase [Angustibacter aerolatus]|uniref:Aldehyde dehydrogenase n=1 Tax=Angustibacter aerolatus TaxID=1162965 RepID=A0ABQ6JHA7_9ACTN|nr:aldehyde dehydrogenase [Angustibacter aerolatus]